MKRLIADNGSNWITYLIYLFTFYPVLCFSQPRFTLHEIDPMPGNAAVGDVNNDGRNDIIIVRDGEQGTFAWYESLDNGTLQKHLIQSGVHFSGNRIVAGDVDRDGDLDVATVHQVDKRFHIVVLRNPLPGADPSQAGSWTTQIVGPHIDYMKDLAIADFDSNGCPDIVSRTHRQTTIYYQHNRDQWPATRVIPHEDHEGMAVADMDLDGDPDIVLNGFWFETPDDQVRGTFRKHNYDAKWFTQDTPEWRDNNAAIAVGDVTGDGIPDIVISHSEKTGWPISLYSVSMPEQTKTGPWLERRIAEVFDWCQTLDIGDIDNDGDPDVVAAKFQREIGKRWNNEPPHPVTIFYNVKGDGSHWLPVTIGEKGMYAGVLGDVGSDGDLDLIGPYTYWQGPLQWWENSGAGSALVPQKTSSAGNDVPPRYYIPVTVHTGNYARHDKPVEVDVSFADALRQVGVSSAVHAASLRVEETDHAGTVLHTHVVMQFDPDPGDAAKGTLIFLMEGETPAQSFRYFRIGFDTQPVTATVYIPDAIAVSTVKLHDVAHWKIQTRSATGLFDQTGGGFSELHDIDGSDWIQYRNYPKHEWRGIPNIQICADPKTSSYQSRYTGIFHPGYGDVACTLVHTGPLRVRIGCEAEEHGRWVTVWDIFPDYARCTLTGGNADGIGYLYEGVPGGGDWNPRTAFTVRADGSRRYFDNPWEEDLSPEWVYFGDDRAAGRVLWYAHHEDDEIPEKTRLHQYLTVFGFAREEIPGISAVAHPQHFSFGFYEGTEHTSISAAVNSAYRDLDVRMGEPRRR